MKKLLQRVFWLTMMATIALAVTANGPIFAQDKANVDDASEQEKAIEKLRKTVTDRDGSEIAVKTDSRGHVSIVQGKLSEPIKDQPAESAARSFLDANKKVFGLANVKEELKTGDVIQDAFGLSHVRFDQYYKSVPVFGHTLTVHFDKTGRIHAVTSDLAADIKLPSVKAAFTKSKALKTARASDQLDEMPYENSELVVYQDESSGNTALAYAVHLSSLQYNRIHIVDAVNGQILNVYEKRHSGSVNGSGTDVFGNTVNPLHVYTGTDYPYPSQWNAYMNPTTGSAQRGSYNMIDVVHTGLGNVFGLCAEHTNLTAINWIHSSTSTFAGTDGTISNSEFQAAVSAAFNFESTLTYFKNKHNRNGIDNAGMAVVHITNWYDAANPINAYWSGDPWNYMAFSNAEGSGTYNPLSGAIDVVGHELAHGVTDKTSNLAYQNHSGALNESWSDIMGWLIEYYATGDADWLLGEDVYKVAGNAFRSLSDPPAFGDPDRVGHPNYTAPVANPSGSNDYGGVHSNSGIPNKVFYLLVNGGNHYGVTINPFSANLATSSDLVGALQYLVNAGGYYGVNTTFDEARTLMETACQALYPGDNAKLESVQNAWYSVSVGSGPPQQASYATLPYTTGFESGSLDQYWTTASSSSFGRIQVTTANGPQTGSRHLTMDVTTNGNYATNEGWLHLDLSGESQVDLGFWWKEFGDETHSQDGIYFSDNGGSSFVKAQNLNGQSYTNNTWQQFTLDLDQLAASAGLSLSATFVVKFQQYDNYAITTDGFAFDEISVTAGGAPPNNPPTANANGPYTGTEGVAVSFSSAGSTDSDGSIVGYLWTFGDGNTSTQANPSHTYAAAGAYSVSLTVTDDDGAEDTDNTTADISAPPTGDYATVPYATGFEGGALDQYWSTSSSNSFGRIQVTTANTPHGGSNHLTMDVTTNGNFAQNEAWLRLDLTGEPQVDLSFWWKEFGDETHAQDGVYFSDNDGASFVKVLDLAGQSYTNNTWQNFALDVDQLAGSNGLSLSATFVVKFQQYDNYAIATDGFAFDDVSVAQGSGGGGGYATLPYTTGFESGSFDQYWTTTSTVDGRVQVVTANSPHGGSYHLTMDEPTSGTYSQNEAWLHLDLSSESQVDLDFWWKEFGDETHAQDGIYFSDNDGASFVKVQGLNGASYTNNTWQNFLLDVDALASANGLSLSATFVIKFQQYDNYPIATDGFAFDDIAVTAGSGGGPSYISAESEPNDASGSADGPVGTGVGVSAAIGNGTDQDWFYFDVQSAGNINVSVSYTNGAADLDWFLYNASLTEVARGYTTGNPEAGSFTATAGRYYLMVNGYQGSTSDYTLSVTGGLAKGSLAELPKVFKLHQNYPNPFNPTTTIRYDLPEEGHVTLTIYNVLGQEVRSLVNGFSKTGFYSIVWDAKNSNGIPVSSGLYIYRIQAGRFISTQKMTFVK